MDEIQRLDDERIGNEIFMRGLRGGIRQVYNDRFEKISFGNSYIPRFAKRSEGINGAFDIRRCIRIEAEYVCGYNRRRQKKPAYVWSRLSVTDEKVTTFA